MTAPAPKASGRPRLARFLSLVFLMLAYLVLPQQAAAQAQNSNSIAFMGSTITIADATGIEGGTATFLVTAYPALRFHANYSVEYVAGTANLDDLGSSRPTYLHIHGYEFEEAERAYLEVPINDDQTTENEETFTVKVYFEQVGSIQATGTIIDNHDATVDLVAVREVREDANNLTFRVNLDTVLTKDVTLPWAVTGGTASAADFDEDYAATGMVTILRGQSFARVQFGLVDDVEVENTETLVLTISSPPSGVTIGTATATGMITDDDAAAPTVNLRAVSDVTEGDRRLTFRVDLNTDLADDITLSWAVSGGTASAEDFDEDYAANGTVTITSGRRTVPIQFVPVIDGVIEGNESLALTISNPPSGVTIGTAIAMATITDDADDERPQNSLDIGGIVVTIADAVVTEGGTALFRLTTAPSTPFSAEDFYDVTYTAGSAVLDDLGSGRPTRISFDGSPTATLEVPINDDDTVEDNETFTVTVDLGSNIGAPNFIIQATGTIVDDDEAALPAVDTILTIIINLLLDD